MNRVNLCTFVIDVVSEPELGRYVARRLPDLLEIPIDPRLYEEIDARYFVGDVPFRVWYKRFDTLEHKVEYERWLKQRPVKGDAD